MDTEWLKDEQFFSAESQSFPVKYHYTKPTYTAGADDPIE